jgi:hypothetical protein
MGLFKQLQFGENDKRRCPTNPVNDDEKNALLIRIVIIRNSQCLSHPLDSLGNFRFILAGFVCQSLAFLCESSTQKVIAM